MLLAYIPSPSNGVWHLGPVPVRAYALCIILGIVAAVWIGERRWVERGGRPGTVSDVAVWAVVFGLVGGRLYHVLTDPELYFKAGQNPWDAVKIWEGGLGIWGAIALGGVGAWLACHRRGIKLPPFADAVAPGIAVAQGIGRWGNWFNQELFGRPTTLPWGLEIEPGRPSAVPGAAAYHPTFLYESLWDLVLAVALILVDRRFRLGRGRVFALYVMGYTVGRAWIEALRIDTANTIFGVRLNIWTSAVVFVGALVYFMLHRGPRETDVEPAAVTEPAAEATAEGAIAEGATAEGAIAEGATTQAAPAEAGTEEAGTGEGATAERAADDAGTGAGRVSGAARVGPDARASDAGGGHQSGQVSGVPSGRGEEP